MRYQYSPLLYQNAPKRYKVSIRALVLIQLSIILERYKTLQGINIALYYIRTLQNATRYQYSPLLYWNATKRYKVLIYVAFCYIRTLQNAMRYQYSPLLYQNAPKRYKVSIRALVLIQLSIILERYKTLQGINIALYYIGTLQNATRYQYSSLLYWNATKRYKVLIYVALYYIRTLQNAMRYQYSPLLYQNAPKRYKVSIRALVLIQLSIILERYKTLQGINIALYYIRTLQNATRYQYSPLLYWNATKRYKVLIYVALYYIRTLQNAMRYQYSPLLYQNAPKRYEVSIRALVLIQLSIILERYKTLQGINIALYYIRTLQNATRYQYSPLLYWNATKRYKVLIYVAFCYIRTLQNAMRYQYSPLLYQNAPKRYKVSIRALVLIQLSIILERYKTLQGINIALYYIGTLQNATRYQYSSLLYWNATKRCKVLIQLFIILKPYKTLQGINIALYYIRTLQNATRYQSGRLY